MIKKILKIIIPTSFVNQLVNFKILSFYYGQYKTILKWNCIDSDGNKIPWYTYPAIEYLSNIDFSQKDIFEYGSGNSSTFWSKRSKSVTSVEHDKVWFDQVRSNLNENHDIILASNNSEYENAIKRSGKKYDVIIVDGIRRFECCKCIHEFINDKSSSGYMIILENSDWYQETAKYLREEFNLIEVDFHGFGPINRYTWTTSIFLSRNFNFKPLNQTQPHYSVAAINKNCE